jgi:hypothetical protein
MKVPVLSTRATKTSTPPLLVREIEPKVAVDWKKPVTREGFTITFDRLAYAVLPCVQILDHLAYAVLPPCIYWSDIAAAR